MFKSEAKDYDSSSDSDSGSDEPTPKHPKPNSKASRQGFRESYIKSLVSWRKYDPTDKELKAVKLFFDVPHRLLKSEIEEILNQCHIKLSLKERYRVMEKVYAAIRNYLPIRADV